MSFPRFRYLIVATIIVVIVLALSAFLLPLPFSVIGTSDVLGSIAWLLTESAGKYGTVIIMFSCAVFFALRFRSAKKRLFHFAASFFLLISLTATLAWFNEHVTKPALHLPRPSHLYIINHCESSLATLDSIYTLPQAERGAAFLSLMNLHAEAFAGIDKKVTDHWIDEAGFSFPSGHSFNAFLLAVILSFAFMSSRKKAIRSVWFVPLVWALLVALSRVCIGAHSALDVSCGATMGSAISLLLLSFTKVKSFVSRREEPTAIRP